MSRKYTLEDVETLRNKAGVSYEDAVALLDKYDGDVARALIELEKRGQLGQSAQNARFSADEAGAWIKRMWNKGMTTRVIVERKGTVLINLSAMFLLLMLILGPYAVIAAFILMLVSGCSVSVKAEGRKEQTVLRGEDGQEAAQPEEQPIEEPFKQDEPEKAENKDDDFPSITIS